MKRNPSNSNNEKFYNSQMEAYSTLIDLFSVERELNHCGRLCFHASFIASGGVKSGVRINKKHWRSYSS